MHALGAVGLRIYLAPKNHGNSISAQSYDFCPRLIKLDILNITLSHIDTMCQVCHTGRTKKNRLIFCTGGLIRLFSVAGQKGAKHM